MFVCTHNSARSQLAAALWRQRTGRPVPAGMSVEAVRPIRDDIERRVRALLDQLDVAVTR